MGFGNQFITVGSHIVEVETAWESWEIYQISHEGIIGYLANEFS